MFKQTTLIAGKAASNGARGFGLVGIIIALAVVLLVGGGYFVYEKYLPGLFFGCTKEAYTCPDGSMVGHVPPTCRVEACPGGEKPDRSRLQKMVELENQIDTSGLVPSGVEGWKTYRNEKYGFEVKYPLNLYVKEFKLAVSFTFETPPTGEEPALLDNIAITFRGNYVIQEFNALFKASQGDDVLEAQNAVDIKVTKLRNLKLGNYDAVEYVRDGLIPPKSGLGRGPIGYEHHVLIKKSDQEFFDLMNQAFEVEKTRQRDPIFNEMVSTFKFIKTGSVNTSIWKTYRVGAEGFEGTSQAVEFKYPVGWDVISSDFASVIIADSNNPNVSRISFFKWDTNPEGSLMDVNNIKTTSPYQFLNMRAKKLVGESGVTGKEVNILVIESQNIYYVIQAPPELFEQVVSTFKFIQ